jgi:GT2 family glycosyltransferase
MAPERAAGDGDAPRPLGLPGSGRQEEDEVAARPPDLSIVIVNRNTQRLLRACLASLRPEGDDLDLEVIVVDNGSADGSVEMVRAEYPEARLIVNEENTGFAIPNNQGMAAARGRHIMLLNSDTEVGRGALLRLVSVLDADPTIGLVGPALWLPSGVRQRSAASFKTPWRHFCDMLGLGRLFPRSALFANQQARLDFARPQDVDWLIAAAVVASREAVERVGGLDERFRIHCNDDDWCRRIRGAGYRIRYDPAAEVLHHSGATIGAETAVRSLDQELVSNLFAYYRKYYGNAGVAWLRFWMVWGYGARAVMARARSRLTGDEALRARGGRFGTLAWTALVGADRDG